MLRFMYYFTVCICPGSRCYYNRSCKAPACLQVVVCFPKNLKTQHAGESAMLRTGTRSKVVHSIRTAVWKAQTRTAVFRHGRMVQPNEPGPKPLTWGGRAPFGLRMLAVGSTLVAFYFTYWTSAAETSERPPDLNLRTFTRAVVHSITQDPPDLGSKADHMVVRMTIPQQFLPKDASHLANAIHHIYIRDDDMQVERPYTPLYGIGTDGKVVLWVKKHAGGEVSNWISRRKRNESVGVRGPVLQWDWRSGSWDEIIMVRALLCPCEIILSLTETPAQISGGTGMTAFAQLLNQALFSSNPVSTVHGATTRFTLLHGHRSPSQLPPQVITEDFERYREGDPDRFQDRAFIDRLETEYDEPPRGVTIGRIDKSVLEKVLLERGVLLEPEPLTLAEKMRGVKPRPRMINPNKSVKILVCGPEG